MTANMVDTCGDLTSLYREPFLSSAGYEDVLMVASKLFQSIDDIIKRKSPDEIYDEINSNIYQLTKENLREMLIDEDEGDENNVIIQEPGIILDAIFLDKVFERRKGVPIALGAIASRVIGTASMPWSKLEWWDWTVTFICRRLAEEEDERFRLPLCLFRSTASVAIAMFAAEDTVQE